MNARTYTPTAVERRHCDACDAFIDPDDVGPPLYECGTCGTFNRDQSENENHQCPSCSKFGAKVADDSCPECETGELDAGTVTVYTVDVDGYEVIGTDADEVARDAAEYAAACDATPRATVTRRRADFTLGGA